MYKYTVNYENFDGESVSEDLYFNLTKAEITKLQLTTPGGFDKHIQAIIDSKDTGKIIELFEKLILMSYGQRTPEGGFKKDKNIVDQFVTTEAYSELFMALLSDADKQQAFFTGIMPKDLAAQATKEIEAKKLTIVQ